MPEYARRRSALATAYREGGFGASPAAPGVKLAERRHLDMAQVATWPDRSQSLRQAVAQAIGPAPPTEPNTTVRAGDTTILWVGPERWLVVAPLRAERPLAEALRATIAPNDAAIVDLGQARTIIRCSGPHVRDILAKGTGVDLHPWAFPPGACAQTLLDHISALLDCVDDTPTIDVYVARSYALTFWEWLAEAAGEYGYAVEPAR
jgi:heterotetrameric sarcosine oxidase gamma subunit